MLKLQAIIDKQLAASCYLTTGFLETFCTMSSWLTNIKLIS